MIIIATVIAAAISSNALAANAPSTRLASFRTPQAEIVLDSSGAISGLLRRSDGRNFLASGVPSPLLSIRVDGKLIAPTGCTYDPKSKTARLSYPGAEAQVVVITKGDYVRLELVSLQTRLNVELILWGPFPTTIGQTIGDTVGVVRSQDFAIGIQALNAKTLGGYPTNENDIEAESSGDDQGIYPDLPAELLKGQGYRSDAARPTPYGSSLQAFCRNRNTERVIPNWGHEKYMVPPFTDGGVTGSAIALFAVPEARALETIGEIEVKEGLPHPMLDGKWAKVSPTSTSSYLIVDFSEKSIDDAITMTRKAGLKFLYHSSPFETWGHFVLKKSLFPNGWAGFKACVDKASKKGIRVGFHTLSNFITPNDTYASPRPDGRLAKIGTTQLEAAISSSDTEITVEAPDYFKKHTTLNTVQIGSEMITYEKVTEEAPYKLTGCKRGAWGTAAAPHAASETVSKLLDHDYRTFLGDAHLSEEIAQTVAKFCNETGARQLSFDGLEGNWASGYGQYGRTLFTDAWYRALAPAIKGGVINDASNPGHFNWHIATRMNWGEPWYAGFRESQTLYRFKNQVYFERNLMPHMLGWFALGANTTVEDAEWLLARAAGFKAGFALAASLASTAQLAADPSSAETAKRYGSEPAILEAINQWERARRLDVFPADVRAALRDNQREFHMEPIGGRNTNAWNLYEVFSARTDLSTDAPVTISLHNSADSQQLRWSISAGDKPLTHIEVRAHGGIFTLPATASVPAGGSVRYDGGSFVGVYNGDQKEVLRIPVQLALFAVPAGPTQTSVKVSGKAKFEVRLLGVPTRISSSDSSSN